MESTVLKRHELPTPYNLSAQEWIENAQSKLRDRLQELEDQDDDDTELADVLDDLCNAMTVMVGKDAI